MGGLMKLTSSSSNLRYDTDEFSMGKIEAWLKEKASLLHKD